MEDDSVPLPVHMRGIPPAGTPGPSLCPLPGVAVASMCLTRMSEQFCEQIDSKKPFDLLWYLDAIKRILES